MSLKDIMKNSMPGMLVIGSSTCFWFTLYESSDDYIHEIFVCTGEGGAVQLKFVLSLTYQISVDDFV